MRVEVDVVGERHRARVDLEDLAPPGAVGRLHGDAAVEAPGRSSAGSRISGRLVAPSTTTASVGLEAVHLGQDLVERLLALVVGAGDAAPSPAASGRSRRARR